MASSDTAYYPDEDQKEDVELGVIQKVGELEEERFDFSMFFIMGLVFLLIGFFRMIVLNEMTLLDQGFIVLGFVISLTSQTWFRRKRVSSKEKKIIQDRKEAQFEYQSSDFGFTEQYHRNKELDKYTQQVSKEKIRPDVDHKDVKINPGEQASYVPDRKLEDDTNQSGDSSSNETDL